MGLHQTSPYHRPSKGSVTERVWQVADEITARNGRKARRKDVIEAFVAEGGNANTASTQYYYWSLKHAEAVGAPVSRPAVDGPWALRVDGSGRLQLPQELREAMALGESGRVTARLVDGELRLLTPEIALRKLQAKARELGLEGRNIVDEFIAERRIEAANE